MFEPLARFGHVAFFLFGNRLVVKGGIGEGAGDRIEHYLHEVHNGSHLVGGQVVEHPMSLLFVHTLIGIVLLIGKPAPRSDPDD